MSVICPICGSNSVASYATVDGFDYFECHSCEALFLDPTVLSDIDNGRSLVAYSDDYWRLELQSSRDRSFGSSLARVAEAFLYSRRTIDVFLDIGAGPGYLLEACATYMPASVSRFYGIEKFPPADRLADCKNLVIGEISDLSVPIDAGCCIEVIEHLTPSMLSGMLRDLSVISNDDAMYIFNSGQPRYVKHEDPRYLDPTGRGHLVSYAVKSMEILAEPHGFRVHPLPGKTWAFLLEKTSSRVPEYIQNRIWAPLQANRDVLNDPKMGSVMYVLGLESARAYG